MRHKQTCSCQVCISYIFNLVSKNVKNIVSSTYFSALTNLIVSSDIGRQLPAPFSEGAFYLPTLIGGLPVDSRCSREEIFGPVVVVHCFDDEAEVVAWANNTRYGLAGSVWTQHLQRAHRVAQSIRTGMIWVNCWLKRDLRVPFGGIGDSGIGREGGSHSIDFYSELKNICIQL